MFRDYAFHIYVHHFFSKTYLLSFALSCFLFSNALNAQNEFVKLYGSGPFDVWSTIQYDTSENVFYAAGRINNSRAFARLDTIGNVQWLKTYDTLYPAAHIERAPNGDFLLAGDHYVSNSNRHNFVMRTDAMGNVLWTKIYYGNTGSHRFTWFAKSAGDSYFIATWFSGDDMVLTRIDGSGNIIWSKAFDNGADDQVYDIVAASDGGCYFICESNISGNWRAFIGKVDVAGNLVWSKHYGNLLFRNRLTIANDGGLIVSGDGFNGFGTITRMDENGNIQWVRKVENGASHFVLSTSTQDGFGNIYVWGIENNTGGHRQFLLKYDENGSLIKAKDLGEFDSQWTPDSRLIGYTGAAHNKIIVGGWLTNHPMGNNGRDALLAVIDTSLESCITAPKTISSTPLSMATTPWTPAISNASFTVVDTGRQASATPFVADICCVDSIIVAGDSCCPRPTGVNNDTTICLGDSVQLFAYGGQSYVWTPDVGLDSNTSPMPIASPTFTTSYKVIIFDSICGTTTYNVLVTIGDSLPPTLAGCPPDITTCSSEVSWTEPTAADNCGIDTISSNYSPGSSFPVGTTTVVYTATDNDGNSDSCFFTITVQNTTLTTNVSVTNASSAGASDGAIDLTVSNGAPPYSFSWSNSSNTEDISGLMPGSYSVTIIDSDSCSVSVSVEVGVDSATCDQLTGVVYTNIDTTSALLNWNPGPLAIGYQIQYRQLGVPASLNTLVAMAPASSKLLTGLMPGTLYQSRIRQNCGSYGLSPWRFKPFTTPVMRIAEQNFSLKVSPNPADEAVSLVLNLPTDNGGLSQKVSIEVFSLLGQKIYNEQENIAGHLIHKIEIKNWPRGQYLIKVKTRAGNVSEKIMVVD